MGRAHPLRHEARAFFLEHVQSGDRLVTSAEVLQELLHAYLPVGRLSTLDAALTLARSRTTSVWPVEAGDVELARSLVRRRPELGARDLLQLASCVRRGADGMKSFDRALQAAFSRGGKR